MPALPLGKWGAVGHGLSEPWLLGINFLGMLFLGGLQVLLGGSDQLVLGACLSWGQASYLLI